MFARVDLDHLRDIQRVHSSERISCNKNYTTVRIDLLLSIAKFYRLQDFKTVRNGICGNIRGKSYRLVHSNEINW